ncbi:MAG: hypothetical protein OXE76_12605 [Alphaproteobacteria bacterium]|nr:hypothetical protein [Alphaproteobacteria bacterium]
MTVAVSTIGPQGHDLAPGQRLNGATTRGTMTISGTAITAMAPAAATTSAS